MNEESETKYPLARYACCEDYPHYCPGCRRIMSHREATELGHCDDGGCE